MPKQNTGVIYCLTNTINGKQYIGQTVDFSNRMHKHLNGQSGCPVLSNAIEKYGTAAFRVESLRIIFGETISINGSLTLSARWIPCVPKDTTSPQR